MEDHGMSLNKFCPCTQTQCRIRGNCVICVQNHLDNKRHIPECFQNLLRDGIQSLARMVQFKTEEARPAPPSGRGSTETSGSASLSKDTRQRTTDRAKPPTVFVNPRTTRRTRQSDRSARYT
jgi:hypothetical protein